MHDSRHGAGLPAALYRNSKYSPFYWTTTSDRLAIPWCTVCYNSRFDMSAYNINMHTDHPQSHNLSCRRGVKVAWLSIFRCSVSSMKKAWGLTFIFEFDFVKLNIGKDWTLQDGTYHILPLDVASMINLWWRGQTWGIWFKVQVVSSTFFSGFSYSSYSYSSYYLSELSEEDFSSAFCSTSPSTDS